MTVAEMGRPKRSRPTDRVNYKLDSDLRLILQGIAERNGRNEGAEVEQLILFYEAASRLNAEKQAITFDAIEAMKRQMWEKLTEKSGDPSID
jgi:gamma-glutamylcysteine synthetase